MKSKRKIRSFDLFSGYAYFVPGFGQTIAILAFMALGLLISVLAKCGLEMFSHEFASTYGMLIIYPLLFIPVMMYASFVSRNNAMFEEGYALNSRNFGKFNVLSLILAVTVATIALAVVMDWVTAFLPDPPKLIKDALDKVVKGPLWVSVLSAGVMAPFFEEWLCRGIILRGLLQKTNPSVAIIISALIFAFIHLNPWQAIPAFAMGLLFGFVYYRTGSLLLTMFMHFVNNALCIALSQVEPFSKMDSISEMFSPTIYAFVVIACGLMVLYFVMRLLAATDIPEGRTNACRIVRHDIIEDPVNE